MDSDGAPRIWGEEGGGGGFEGSFVRDRSKTSTEKRVEYKDRSVIFRSAVDGELCWS